MKNLNILLIVLWVFLSSLSFAQNNEGKANDKERISLTPQVSDQEIPQGAKKLLLNKMKQICAKNGLSGDGMNPFFVMDASVDILTKELTPTAPPMHALNMQVNFFIKDVVNNNVYSETSIEVKGVGTNETKAYIAGLKNINTSKGQFKALVDRGKTKILEFYNSECDYIISKANALKEQGNNGEAIKVLKSVPKVNLECYAKCMEILGTIEPPAEPEPQAQLQGSNQPGSSGNTMAGAAEQEIEQGVYLVYMGGQQMGNKTILNFEFQNRGTSDFELNDYALDNRAIDGNGNEFKVEKVKTAGTFGSRSMATVMNTTPVPMECQFAKMQSVAMFEFKYKGKLFRFKDLPVNAASNAAAIAPAGNNAQPGSAAPVNANIKIGDKVLAELSGSDEFRRHKYVPAKIITLASAATKNEYEIMSMGDGSSENKWTDKVVAKWHVAKKEELSEGLVILYSDHRVDETATLYAGVVVAVDELYKNIVTVKGRYNDIYKLEVGLVVIPDFPKVKAP